MTPTLAIAGRRAIANDLRHRAALGPQPGQKPPLVLKPAPCDDVQLRVSADRRPNQSGQRGAVQVRQVLAGEKADEVCGRIDRPAVDQLHGMTLPGDRVSLTVAGGRKADGEQG